MTADTIAFPAARQRQNSPLVSIPMRRVLAAAPLVLILVVQLVLTLRLMPYVGSDHDDEAIYIYGGHQLIFEALHGGGTPFLETWYSGAPVMYPVLAAVVDHLGGLQAVRGMSAILMLCTTALLFLTARRLFGYWTGVIAAGLFAGLGITQSLGSLATIDTLCLVLLAAAAYCAVRSAESTRWLLMVPAALLLANAAKYMSVLFDPVVIGMSAFLMIPEGWRRVSQRILALGSATLLTTCVVVFLAGGAYFKGIMFTTLARKGGAQAVFGAHFASPAKVVQLSWGWIGAVVALGILGLILVLLRPSERRTHGPLLALLIIAGLEVTLGNMRLHTDQSMDKHDDFGVWFVCIAAAYGLTCAAGYFRRRWVKVQIFAIAAIVTGLSGHYYSQASAFRTFFRTTSITAYRDNTYSFLSPYLRPGKSEYLLASMDDFVMVYDNRVPLHWWQFFDDTYVKYPIPGRGGAAHAGRPGLVCGDTGLPSPADPQCMYLEGEAGYAAAIRAHWFALVTLVNDHGLENDRIILATLRSTPGYVQISDFGGGPTFIYAADYPEWHKASWPRTLSPVPL